MHYGNGGWSHMGGISLWWLCGIAAVATLIWFGVASARARGGPDTPESILKRRYASGEITREEYTLKLEELRH